MGNILKFLIDMIRIKEWVGWRKKEIVFASIIFFVAVLSFGLGYLANREFNHASIVIQKMENGN